MADASSACAADPRLSGLLGQLSHDLRTPLNAIVGFSDIMERELLGPIGAKPYQSYAGHIRESGLALVQTIDDLLHLMRILAERNGRDTGPVDLAPVVREAVDLHSARPSARPFEVEIKERSKRRAVADRSVVVHAVGNLLHCAACRAPAYATITVSTAARTIQAGSVATMIDYPSGAAARTDVNALGLTIARSLVEMQGGSLTEMPERRGLSRLVMTLPAA